MCLFERATNCSRWGSGWRARFTRTRWSIRAKENGRGSTMKTWLISSTFSSLCATLLCSCAPAVYSVYHTASMSPQQLTEVDEVTLCDSAIPVGVYRPRPEIVREVERRGLDCSKYLSRSQSPVTTRPLSLTRRGRQGPLPLFSAQHRQMDARRSVSLCSELTCARCATTNTCSWNIGA
jgi:hypothetical protein